MLRDYQVDAIEGLRDLYRQNFKKPILVLPTGAGKTVIFTKIAQIMSSKFKDVLILVHRVELVRQTCAKLDGWGIKYSVIHPDYAPAPIRENVVVASVQTLSRKIPSDLIPDLIIIDEAHHASAKSYQKIIQTINPPRLLGVTATPSRLDGQGLNDIFDSIYIGISVNELIKRNYLVKPRIFSSQTLPNMNKVKKRGGDFLLYEAEIAINTPKITGNAVKHYEKLAAGKRAIAFCVSVKHAEEVAERFRSAGYRAETLSGELNSLDRKNIINKLESGEIQIITSCEVISEGTDIPAVEVAILLRPTMSENLYLQQVGRVLRPADNKSYAIILDHVGNVQRFGLPQDERKWDLNGIETKLRKSEPSKVRTCKTCFCVFPNSVMVCPECNTLFIPKQRKKIAEIDGDLMEIQDVLDNKPKKFKTKTLNEWLAIAKLKGYAPGWAFYRYSWQKQKFNFVKS